MNKKNTQNSLNTPQDYFEHIRVLREQKAYKKAMCAIDEAFEKFGESSQLFSEKGKILLESDRYREAKDCFLKVISSGSEEENVIKDLVKACRCSSDYKEAINNLEQIYSCKKDSIPNWVLLELGQLYRESGDMEKSWRSYSKIDIQGESGKDKYFANRVLNNIEISQGKTVLQSYPRKMIITLTSRCNCDCIMCRVNESKWDIPFRIIDELKYFLPYMESICWVGGEMLYVDYSENIFDLVCRFPRIRQTIPTNGFLINEKWARKMAQNKVSLMISMDGATKKTYEYIRRGLSFEKLMEKIKLVNHYKNKYKHQHSWGRQFFTEINFVIMKSNYTEMEQIVDLAGENNFDKLMLNPVNSDVFMEEDCFVTNRNEKIIKEIASQMPLLYEKASNYGLELTVCNCGLFDESLSVRNEDKKIKDSFLCMWPWQQLVIDLEGAVLPDPYCKQEIGNVKDQSLKELWNNNVMQDYRKRIYNKNFTDLCNKDCFSAGQDRWKGLE